MTNIQTEYVGNSEGVLNPKARWWLEADGDIYKSSWEIVNNIENNQTFLKAAFARYAALYSNMEFLGLSARMFSRTALNSFFNNRLALNVIKSCTDSATSKIAKNRPRPLFLTEDGDYSQQRKAKQLTKFMEGLFDEMNVYEKAQRCFTDACVFGFGLLKPYIEDGKIKCDRVLPEEISVDEADGIYGEPQQIHQTKYYTRDILVEMFPEHEHKIMSAMSFVRADLAYRSAADQIAVRESWHLKSGEKAKDGKHVICIENCTLFAEEYTKCYFPFIVFRWNPRLHGFWGMGLAEELVGIQLEINKILSNIQRAIHLIGVPRIWVENGSQVNTGMLNNEIGAMYKYTGTPPVFQTAASMSADVYQHLENLYTKAYQITGISQLSASSVKPSGVNSAVAMREYQDIESERFMNVGQRYERSFIELAKICVDLARDLYTGENNLEVKVTAGKFIQSIKWSEVDIADDKYMVRVFPTSLLPSQPQGKLSQIQELVQAGFIGKEDAISLLDFPDLDSFVSLQTASKDNIMMMIENMIDKGGYETPEPFINLQMAITMTQSSYLKARMNSVPEERLELLRRFMSECNDMVTAAQPPMPMPGMPTPTGVPQAPAQAELLPNAPVPGA
jgi:hypothetical protein